LGEDTESSGDAEVAVLTHPELHLEAFSSGGGAGFAMALRVSSGPVRDGVSALPSTSKTAKSKDGRTYTRRGDKLLVTEPAKA
jgi:hypothetical protein